MAKFSQRMGITEIKDKLQLDSIDTDLRVALWNVLTISFWKPFRKNLYKGELITENEVGSFFELLWHDYFKETIDSIPRIYSEALQLVKGYFTNADWYNVYDFIEFVANISYHLNIADNFCTSCNTVLEKELSGYRFIDRQLVPINSPEEIAELENAMNIPLSPVRQHLTRSLELLGDRSNPDYRNSIKEAISAVESMCCSITGEKKATLGEALTIIEKNGTVELHGALKKAFSNLYGYTSNADGIRHALLEDSVVSFEDAKFMLVSCSTFINYLTVKASKAELKLN